MPVHKAAGRVRRRTARGSAIHRLCNRSILGLLTVLLCIATTDSRAQDGNALMHKMLDAYQHLNTYEVHSNVDISALANGRPIQQRSSSNEMSLKRPNKISLIVYNDGPTGTRKIYCDGTTLTVYDALPNRYTSTSVASSSNGEALMRLLAQHAAIVAELDPLYFFCTNKLPPTLSGLKATGAALVNGRPSLVLTGVIHSSVKPAAGNGQTVTAAGSHITWYIDKQTYLINKIEINSDPVNRQVITLIKNKKVPATLKIVIAVHHSIGSFKANAPIEDNVFVFKAPPGALPQKQ